MERTPRPPGAEALEAIAMLPLDQFEEASGELHRRISVALRRIGEALADDALEDPLHAGADHRPPRRQVAELAALIELAALTFGAVAAGSAAPLARIDRHPALHAAVMYAAPTLDALLHRLEQDRRLLTSLARRLEPRLDHEHSTPWGQCSLRAVLADAAIAEPARCAQALERRAQFLEDAELHQLAEAQRDRGDRDL